MGLMTSPLETTTRIEKPTDVVLTVKTKNGYTQFTGSVSRVAFQVTRALLNYTDGDEITIRTKREYRE